jgi:mannose-6-phosphate isomerase-like protein (cupin superfamily)
MIVGQQKGGTPLLQKFRTPCRLSEIDGTQIPRKSDSDNDGDEIHGKHLELVSPDWAMSSNLYCDVVTLPPGTELVPKNAEGVEFYYVVRGQGIYVDQKGEKHEISADYGFIVDPEWYVTA